MENLLLTLLLITLLLPVIAENIKRNAENKKLQQNNIPLHFRTYMPEFQKKGEEST